MIFRLLLRLAPLEKLFGKKRNSVKDLNQALGKLECKLTNLK